MGQMRLGRAGWPWRCRATESNFEKPETSSCLICLRSMLWLPRTCKTSFREVPRREGLIAEHHQICLDLQAKVVALLNLLNERLSSFYRSNRAVLRLWSAPRQTKVELPATEV